MVVGIHSVVAHSLFLPLGPVSICLRGLAAPSLLGIKKLVEVSMMSILNVSTDFI